jgi:hypothetical protein
MRTTVILAEAASDHRDGSYSLLRGGLDRVGVGSPIAFVVVILFDPQEYGNRAFALRLFDGDNRHVADMASMSVAIGPGNRKITMVGRGVQGQVGSFRFVVEVDSQPVATYDYEVVQPPQPPNAPPMFTSS